MKRCLFGLLLLAAMAPCARADDKPWQDVFAKGLDAFKPPHGEWTAVEDVSFDPRNPRRLLAQEGKGAYHSGPKCRTSNLYTKEKYGGLEVHLEFAAPKGSNSGIKFHGQYEIQIMDSF